MDNTRGGSGRFAAWIGQIGGAQRTVSAQFEPKPRRNKSAEILTRARPAAASRARARSVCLGRAWPAQERQAPMTQRKALTIRIDDATFGALAAEGEAEFKKPGTIAARRLEAFYANGRAEPMPMTEVASIKARKATLELEELEREQVRARRDPKRGSGG